MFLDASGSAPITARVANAIRAGFDDGWADPAGLHADARRSRALLDGAREAVAEAIGADAAHVHFTPSPQFAFERLVAGVALARRGRGRIIASAIERDAALAAAEHAAPHHVDTVGVDHHGHVDVDELREALHFPDVSLALVQHANQEIGTVQRLDGIAEVVRGAEVPLIVDATASLGHIDPPAHWDALVGHAADFGGPAGIGIIALRPRTRWLASWPHGDPWAPGGTTVPLALASAVALQERQENRAHVAARLAGYVDRIREGFERLDGVTVIGDPVERLPHVLTAAFMYLDGEPLVSGFDKRGISVGSGSACGRETFEPSKVLAAMGALTHGNVRLGLHPGVDDDDIERFLTALPEVVDQARTTMGASR
jgi:cysteine desulfurase